MYLNRSQQQKKTSEGAIILDNCILARANAYTIRLQTVILYLLSIKESNNTSSIRLQTFKNG
jgi:hypothetical protein